MAGECSSRPGRSLECSDVKWRTFRVFVVLVAVLWGITFGILHLIHGGSPPLSHPYPALAPLPAPGHCSSDQPPQPVPAADADLIGQQLASDGLWDRHHERACMFRRDDFLTVPGFVPQSLISGFLSEAKAAKHLAYRRGVFSPGKGEAIPYEVVKAQMPSIYSLYKSPAFIQFLESLSGEELLTSLEEDPHAAAIYWYNTAGDGINWHYDTSFLEGKRFTVLIPLEDNSSSRLHVQLYTRNQTRQPQDVVLATRPADLIFFNGDQVRHRVTAMGHAQQRVVITLEYVTSHRTSAGPWMIYKLSQWGGYFGFPVELVVLFYSGLLGISYFYVRSTSK